MSGWSVHVYVNERLNAFLRVLNLFCIFGDVF